MREAGIRHKAAAPLGAAAPPVTVQVGIGCPVVIVR